MIQKLFNELVAMYATRHELHLVFDSPKGNYNTIIGRIVLAKYYHSKKMLYVQVEFGISRTLFKRLDALAYARAMKG